MVQSRFSRRIFGFVLFAALAATVPGASTRALAQQAAPAAAEHESAAAPVAARQEAPESSTQRALNKEREEYNEYRHAPIVQSISRMLHLKLETTAQLFEAINFIILALVILVPLGKFLPKFLHKRKQALRNKIEEARLLTEDAKTRLNAVEAKMARLDEEIAAIRAHVEEESKLDEVRIMASIEQESKRIVVAAEQEISAAAAHAQRGLRHFAADLAVEQAARELVMTPETDRALIAEFVRDADKREQN